MSAPANIPAEPVLPLWSGSAPEARGTGPDDIPTLTVYLPKKSDAPTSAILVCPGGGYQGLAVDHEGYSIARWFRDQGVAAFVLKYRLPSLGYRHPVPLIDVSRALRVIRSRTAEWNLDASRIGIIGFSAGGHLASTLITHFEAANPDAKDPADQPTSRPDFAVLVYPVITMKEGLSHGGSRTNLLGPNPDPALLKNLSNETQVTHHTPPTILVHAIDDDGVSVENSRLMHNALKAAGVPTEIHEYPKGGHGFGHGPNDWNNNEPEGWLDKVHTWLKAGKYL